MSTGFRPLSTRALRALELRDLNPVDTSWSAFNYYIYVTGFAKRDHLGLRLDFELGIWSESTLEVLSVAFYGASLAATVFEIRWLELRNYANHNMKKTAFESLLPVKPTTFRILLCY